MVLAETKGRGDVRGGVQGCAWSGLAHDPIPAPITSFIPQPCGHFALFLDLCQLLHPLGLCTCCCFCLEPTFPSAPTCGPLCPLPNL